LLYEIWLFILMQNRMAW